MQENFNECYWDLKDFYYSSHVSNTCLISSSCNHPQPCQKTLLVKFNSHYVLLRRDMRRIYIYIYGRMPFRFPLPGDIKSMRGKFTNTARTMWRLDPLSKTLMIKNSECKNRFPNPVPFPVKTKNTITYNNFRYHVEVI